MSLLENLLKEYITQNYALLKGQVSSIQNLEMQVGNIARYALFDLGASINLMPLSIFKKLGIGEAQPTSVMLQLADRSIMYHEGKVEDVLLKVDKFIFLTDFIILDCEADRDVPIILGRTFIAIGKVLIDVYKGELTMRVDNQEDKFDVLNVLRFLDDAKQCQFIDSIELFEEEEMDQVCEVHILGETMRRFAPLSLNER
ncbi:uncharacterized protein LOC120084129 [Benincasa hispida]|uniref:uncharacterized protein LOC120084129 n=1 Tax=Benincasa hispida TaxID=102211 RepID=UPI0018FFFC38|nr:uncharacterized protein LOC120084129 [Benincasa hispida]